MKNLIIGSTSQLSNYFPSEYERISSRNIDLSYIKKGNYNNVFILFAEQRTFLNETEDFFTKVNVNETLKVIDEIKNHVNKIVTYSTSELWNNCHGPVSISTKFDYVYSPYIKSKEILCEKINEKKENYNNVKIVYPFNFNSPYRKNGFLFNKIFNSILNKEKVYVGDLDFSRDIIHPKIIVENSLDIKNDLMVGSGELINIQNLLIDLYKLFGLDYYNYVIFDEKNPFKNTRKDYYSFQKFSSRDELLNLTFDDLRKNSIS
jgi:nucleoside-diphosphate-sugar epimerase